jgi:hypothetical protein
MKRRSGSNHQINEANVRLHHRMPLNREHLVGLVQHLLDMLLNL